MEIKSKKNQEQNIVAEIEILILCRLMFSYGVMQCAGFVFQTINHFLLKKNVWNTWINLLVDILFALYFLKTYRLQRSVGNKKYLDNIWVWGMLICIIPFIVCATRWMIFMIIPEASLQAIPLLENSRIVIEMFFACCMITFIGVILNKKWMVFLAMFLLLIFLIFNVLGMDVLLSGIYPLVYIVLSAILYNFVQ